VTLTDTSEFAILTRGLVKSFGTHNAVDGIDLKVPKGSVFGFLGPNGSGKTSTIRMLLGLSNITSGEAYLLGHQMPDNFDKALPGVGALVEGPAFYPFLSGKRNLIRLDSANKTADPATRSERVNRALARVGLTAAAEKKVHAYSLGMKQRLAIANALLQPREMLILDEPTNGLDPQGTREIRNLVRTLASEGITFFISSHLLVEIEQICTHLAVMSQGKIVAQGSVDELSTSENLVLTLRTTQKKEAISLLKKLGIKAKSVDGEVVATVTADFITPEEIVRQLTKAKIGVKGFSLVAPTLEERFVSLTGEGFDVAR
jgi:ABC-type multidrug transport system ATPase subunit